jgi:hypothetical protein
LGGDWAIRTGRRDDVEAVLELWLAAGSVPTPTDSREALLVLLAHDEEALVVAEAGGALAGSLIVAWDGWRGSFHRLAVSPVTGAAVWPRSSCVVESSACASAARSG